MTGTTSNVGSSTTSSTVTYSNCSILDEIYELKRKLSELEKKFNNCSCKCCKCCKCCRPIVQPYYPASPWITYTYTTSTTNHS